MAVEIKKINGVAITSIKKLNGVSNISQELNSLSLISDANLLSYYRMEADGTDTKGVNNGTDSNVTHTPIKFGNGGIYNGSTSYTNLGTMGNLGSTLDTGSFTICGWIKTAATGLKLFGTVADGATTMLQLNFNRDKDDNAVDGKTTLSIRDEAGVSNGAEMAANIYDNVLHRIAITFTPSTHAYQWYVDGLPVTTTLANTNNIGTTANFQYGFCLGATNFRGTVANHMACSLDDWAFFTRSLTSGEESNAYGVNIKKYMGVNNA